MREAELVARARAGELQRPLTWFALVEVAALVAVLLWGWR